MPRRARRLYQRHPRVSHDGFHRYLWRHSDRRHRISVNLTEVAAFLDIDASVMRRTMVRMMAEGRARKVGHQSGSKAGIYEIADPSQWDPGDPQTHARAHRVPQWG